MHSFMGFVLFLFILHWLKEEDREFKLSFRNLFLPLAKKPDFRDKLRLDFLKFWIAIKKLLELHMLYTVGWYLQLILSF